MALAYANNQGAPGCGACELEALAVHHSRTQVYPDSAPLTCFIREGMATGHNCTATSAFQRPAGWRRAATSPYPETPEQLRSGLYFAVAVSATRSGCFILQLPRPTQRPQAGIVQERMAKGRNSNCTAPSVNKQQAETTG